jgi:hypothetical protein
LHVIALLKKAKNKNRIVGKSRHGNVGGRTHLPEASRSVTENSGAESGSRSPQTPGIAANFKVTKFHFPTL